MNSWARRFISPCLLLFPRNISQSIFQFSVCNFSGFIAELYIFLGTSRHQAPPQTMFKFKNTTLFVWESLSAFIAKKYLKILKTLNFWRLVHIWGWKNVSEFLLSFSFYVCRPTFSYLSDPSVWHLIRPAPLKFRLWKNL